MNSSGEYIYACFQRTYDEALAANSAGRFTEAERKLGEAAAYLSKYASLAGGERGEKLRSQAERIATIARSLAERNAIDARRNNAETNRKTTGGYGSVAREEYGVFDGRFDDVKPFFTFYEADDLAGGFESVIGLESAKTAITEYVLNPIRYADCYNYRFSENKAVLLEGPPGTGKTTFAKAVAKELERPFALVNVAALVNCYVGETGKNIDKLFLALRSYVEENDCGITVFFDEFDEIAKRRDGDDKASASAVPALLRNLDGVQKNKGFLILANTNCADSLDIGILDRFRKRIHIPLPDENTRRVLFEEKTKEIEDEYKSRLNFDELAREANGLSGRSITYICDDFKYYVGGVKAGIKDGGDLNGVMREMIREKQREGRN